MCKNTTKSEYCYGITNLILIFFFSKKLLNSDLNDAVQHNMWGIFLYLLIY